MSLHTKIKGEIKEAMLAKDTDRLGVVRGLVAAFVNELVSKSKKSQEELTDEEVLAVIRRAVKQRKDSIEQFKAGGRNDLVETETKELKILETYLPQLMSKEDIEKIAKEKKASMGITDLPTGQAGKAGMGKFMGVLMKELKGKADGTEVKEVVEKLFN